ncbi:MAG: tyrosine-protein phosphatase [Dietzia sp.]
MTATAAFELSPPVNLRPLAGIPIRGGVLCEGLAIRADDLSTITSDVADDLVAGGLTSIIDLRSAAEVDLTGRGPLATRPVSYHHLPVMQELGAGLPRDTSFLHDPVEFGRLYADLVDAAATGFATALTIISLSPGATAFHCAAGRDRTGVLAALLLLVLGADDDDIVTDYARTDDNMTAIATRLGPVMSVLMAGMGFDIEELASTRPPGGRSPGTSMRTMLELLRERHGDPLAPLWRAELDDRTASRLRRRALGS